MNLPGCYSPPDLGGSCCLGRGPAAGLFLGLASPQEMRWATGILPRGVGPTHGEGEGVHWHLGWGLSESPALFSGVIGSPPHSPYPGWMELGFFLIQIKPQPFPIIFLAIGHGTWGLCTHPISPGVPHISRRKLPTFLSFLHCPPPLPLPHG